jgi:hypothetical protein
VVDRESTAELEAVYPDLHLTSDMVMKKINETRELKASGNMPADAEATGVMAGEPHEALGSHSL